MSLVVATSPTSEESETLVVVHNSCVVTLEKSCHEDLDVRRGWCEV